MDTMSTIAWVALGIPALACLVILVLASFAIGREVIDARRNRF